MARATGELKKWNKAKKPGDFVPGVKLNTTNM